ncbi:hypothetical protein BWI17_01855 [Betaproteobacteria bacterium GR16-43]|nr:hypothetical protein BWI17_01855 [Betaproteobacteria bacterium GR16-43]
MPLAFPRLVQDGCEVTSNCAKYNCVAWAANVTHQCWWPDGQPHHYWPEGCPLEETVAGFEAVFIGKLGYERAANADLESGFEKVALYVNPNDIPLHMARQLEDGNWTSKCGVTWDLTHYSLDSLRGGANDYGNPKYIYRRPTAQAK